MIEVNIPAIGLTTIAKNENDIVTAVSEAVIVFCMAAEKYGKGIEAEIKKVEEDRIGV